MRRSARRLGVLVTALAVSGCEVQLNPKPTLPEKPLDRSKWVVIEPPSPPGAIAPDLLVNGDALHLSWTERSTGSPTARVMTARREGGSWSVPVQIAAGDDLFANWADFPHLASAADGTLYTHWLAKTSPETYAYSIELARSLDRGDSWEPIGRLNDDDTHTEHGFVSYVPEGDGVRAFYLDGREMVDGGPMALRTALVTDAAGPTEVVDSRVCECCSTDAAVSSSGPRVVYRDRGDDETRDTWVVAADAGGWSAPQPVHRDRWKIEGCPVNGPEVSFAGELGAVAWFTAAGEQAQVRLALSLDGGESFAEPVVLDEAGPLGRVGVAADTEGAWVVWMAVRDQRAAIQLARVSADGTVSEPMYVAETSVARSSGFPRLVRSAGSLYLAWVWLPDGSDETRIRVLEMPLA